MVFLGWKLNTASVIQHLRDIQPQIIQTANNLQNGELIGLNDELTNHRLLELVCETGVLIVVVNALGFDICIQYGLADPEPPELNVYFGFDFTDLGPIDTRSLLTVFSSPDYPRLESMAQSLGAIRNEPEVFDL